MFPVCRSRVDLVVALDASFRSGPVAFQKMLDFVRRLASMIDVGPGNGRMALLSFSDYVDFRFHLDDFSSFYDVSNAISMDYA